MKAPVTQSSAQHDHLLRLADKFGIFSEEVAHIMSPASAPPTPDTPAPYGDCWLSASIRALYGGLWRGAKPPDMTARGSPWRQWARSVRRFVADPTIRSEWLTRWRHRDAIHQDASFTRLDRYPALFGAAQRELGETCDGAILSFGCSSGEEVVTLRRYFPHARLVGAEINGALLARCRRLAVTGEVAFVRSSHANIAAMGPYDAIFCMAVLQRRPHRIVDDQVTNIADLYPFRAFAAELAFLAGQLRPGGLLVIEHSQYRVEDLQTALGLEPVPGASTAIAKGARFDPAGQRIDPLPVIDRIFRHVR